jgi:diadenosine tetraphosphate (Ap4A) HIT family hydrolase
MASLDAHYRPDGYNAEGNNGAVGVQEVFHADLHLIPRFANEPPARASATR